MYPGRVDGVNIRTSYQICNNDIKYKCKPALKEVLIWVLMAYIHIYSVILLISQSPIPVQANVANSNVNFNLKSKLLSRMLGNLDSSETNTVGDKGYVPNVQDQTTSSGEGGQPMPSSTPTEKPNFDGVSLDLSGKVECHLSSPKQTTRIHRKVSMESVTRNESRTKPLFRWGTISENSPLSKLIYPSLHIGAKYDFQRAWYGITRLMTTCTWDGKHMNMGHDHDDSAQEGNGGGLMYLSLEKGLPSPTNPQRTKHQDVSAALHIELPQCMIDPFVSIRWDTDSESALASSSSYKMMDASLRQRLSSPTRSIRQCATIIARSKIHPRIQLLFKSILVMPNGATATNVNGDIHQSTIHEDESQLRHLTRSYLSSRIPSERTNWVEGSWLPDISMTPGGMMTAKSQIGMPGIRSASNNKNQYGIRLMLKRQINWSILGIPSLTGNGQVQNMDNGDDYGTSIRLELCGRNDLGSLCNSVCIESMIERPRESLQVSLMQERIMSY